METDTNLDRGRKPRIIVAWSVFYRLNNKFGHKINSYISACRNYVVNKYNGALRINRDVICLTFQSTSHCLYCMFNMYRLCYRYTGFLSVHCEMKACFCLRRLSAGAYRIHVEYWDVSVICYEILGRSIHSIDPIWFFITFCIKYCLPVFYCIETSNFWKANSVFTMLPSIKNELRLKSRSVISYHYDVSANDRGDFDVSVTFCIKQYF